MALTGAVWLKTNLRLGDFMLKQAYYILNELGFNPLKLKNLKYIPRLVKEWKQYNRENKREAFKATFKGSMPLIADYAENAGSIRTHYFHQDLWAARKLYKLKPQKHIDIGSRVDGFISHVLTFMDVTVVDVRPLDDSEVSGLTFICDDATTLKTFEDESTLSISTLHAAEHFGLGRYGDPVDPEATFKFMASLNRVLAKGGTLLFSVPIGVERVEFNAHRVFAIETILENFKNLSLESFSYVDDQCIFHENVDVKSAPLLNFGCGLFEFKKK